jgi:hypothetical protein
MRGPKGSLLRHSAVRLLRLMSFLIMLLLHLVLCFFLLLLDFRTLDRGVLSGCDRGRSVEGA